MDLLEIVSSHIAIQKNPSDAGRGRTSAINPNRDKTPLAADPFTSRQASALERDVMTSISPLKAINGDRSSTTNSESVSPRLAVPKNVAFELLFPESPQSPQYRARLPMRVQIYPHDTTDSIVTTVKNFYGLYSGPTGSKGVSFEDERGNTLIARYENFRNNMVVYVRVFEKPSVAPASPTGSQAHNPGASRTQPWTDGCLLDAPQRFGRDTSRPASRTSRKRSTSPGRGRRSTSASTAGKMARSRSSKNRGTSSHNYAETYNDSINGYSSSDGAPSSASGRAKEHPGHTDISVDNIVEGGRRKRAKFESSELPLFAPPQMPAATSNASVSPARRIEHHRLSLPLVQPGQNPFTNPRPLQSPQTHNGGFGQHIMYATPASEGRRARGAGGYPGVITGNVAAGGILPTPDPTVGSCMSEEDKDVAIQLMRLGDMSNVSHGRTSASTLDDTFSGRADAASSTGATSDADSESEDELPAPRRQKLDASGASRQVYQTTQSHFIPSDDTGDIRGTYRDHEDTRESSRIGDERLKTDVAESSARPKQGGPLAKINKPPKLNKTIRPSPSMKHKKAASISHGPMSPASLPPSRKPSVASANNMGQGGNEDDQPDLSTKPRCQRCRKSKKGCDRQRPCGRCKDAGLSADQCVSEDEGNGRKGRYGRHMGVPIKTEEVTVPIQPALLPAAPIAAANPATDKSKKRKR